MVKSFTAKMTEENSYKFNRLRGFLASKDKFGTYSFNMTNTATLERIINLAYEEAFPQKRKIGFVLKEDKSW